MLISPFLRLSDVFFQRLQDAERRGVRTTIVYGKDELHPAEQDKLSHLAALEARLLENLHAKCYFNEERMVITSMNMYEASEKNRGMGVNLCVGESAFKEAVREAESIISASAAREFRQKPHDEVKQRFTWEKSVPAMAERPRGCCIRCRRGIFLDRDRPFCIDCYQTWATFGDEDYAEQWCHDCGREAPTNMRRPLCDTCLRASNSF